MRTLARPSQVSIIVQVRGKGSETASWKGDEFSRSCRIFPADLWFEEVLFTRNDITFSNVVLSKKISTTPKKGEGKPLTCLAEARLSSSLYERVGGDASSPV
jgi:hypothetical protein